MKIPSNRIVLFIVIVITSLLFTKYYFLFTHEYYEPASSERMAEFTADKVFQKRILSILLAKCTVVFTGLSLDQSLKVWCVLSCIAMLYGFRALLSETSQINLPGVELLLLLPVAWNYIVLNGIYHSYDIPTLAFYSWGIVLFLRRRYNSFYLLYILASLNRESSCFITITIFALLLNTQAIKHTPFRLTNIWRENYFLFLNCIGQAAIWICIKSCLEYAFRENSGTFYEDTFSMRQFIDNAWSNKTSWPYLDTDTFVGNPRCFVTLFGCIWILFPFVWKYIPIEQKKLLWTIPPFLIAALMYANLMETRVYHELNIVLSITIFSGLINFINSLIKKPTKAENDHK